MELRTLSHHAFLKDVVCIHIMLLLSCVAFPRLSESGSVLLCSKGGVYFNIVLKY